MFNALNETFGKVDSNYKSSAQFSSFESLANLIGNLMLGAGLSIGVICLAYAFIQFTTTLGDPKKMRDAKYAALLSAISMLVALLGYAIRSALFKLVS